MKAGLRYLRPMAGIASIALFFCLLQRTGPEAVLQNIRVLGWGMVAVILLSGLRHFLRALAWSYCLPTDVRRPLALEFVGPRLIGEALNDLTPAGPLLGEPAKVVAISRLIPARTGASSVVLENLIYGLGAFLFMLSGVVLAVLAVSALRGLWWIGGGLVIGFLACLAMLCWAVHRRVLLFGRMLDFFKLKEWRWALLERHEQSVRNVEETVYDFFLNNRRSFLAVLAIEIVTNFTGVVEAYFILKVTTAHTSLFAAYLVESASRAVQMAFSFVPLGLGVQEGAAKIRSLFWAAVGLIFLAKYSICLPAAERSTT
jgi:hypothetical protein